MEPERWREVRRLVEAAVTLPPVERDRFLDEQCRSDTELRLEVESLLAVPARALDLLDRLHFRVEAEGPPPGRLGPGDRLGSYCVLQELERGGMGAVYVAEDEEHGRRVAIKVVRSSHGVSAREKRILARLNHANIARLYDSGVADDGSPYFVMEHVEGSSLDRFADERRLGLRERIGLVRKICSAVEYAHSHQVVHRDLKPANILVGVDGEPKLLDFGISKLLDPDEELPPTATGLHAMTPAFASPEQVRGEWTATTSDVYSLGVVLHVLLTGRLPYAVQTQPELFWAIAEVDPERPSRVVARDEERMSPGGAVEFVEAKGVAWARGTTPRALARTLEGDLDAIVLKTLRKEPERRYRTVSDFSEDLRRALEDEPVKARRGSSAYRARKFIRRHRSSVATVAILALLNLGMTAALFIARRESEGARRRAEAAATETAQALGRAGEVQRFLVETFNASNPNRRAPEPETVKDLLDRGRRRLEQAGLDPRLRADVAATVGLAYSGQGLHEEAAEFLEHVLEETQATTGPRSLATATVMDVLGMVERNRGNLTRSEELLRRSLEILSAQEGASDTDIGDGYTELATTLFKAGKLDEAMAASKVGIEVLEASTEEQAESLLGEARTELGLMLHDLGRFEEAESLHRQALATIVSERGRDHPNYGRALNNLAMTLQEQGSFDEAQELLAEASAVYDERLGGDHPELLVNLNNLAAAAYYAGSYEAAAEAQEEVVGRMLAAQPVEHPNSIASLANLGVFRKVSGDMAGARPVLEQAHERGQAALGGDHWLTGNAAFQLARLLEEQGEPARAEALYAEAVATFEESLGAENWRTASAQLEWALLLETKGLAERAELLSTRALEALRGSEGQEHWRTADGESVRAELLMRSGRLEEAEELLLHAIEVLKRDRGEKVVETRNAIRRLAELRTAQAQARAGR